jgi:hypothetical protein
MKRYYSLHELSSTFKIRIQDLFHLILLNKFNKAYIYVDSNDIPYLSDTGAFLQIPKKNIRQMEIYACKAQKIFQLKFSFLNIIKEEENWSEYLNIDEENLNDYISPRDIEQSEQYSSSMQTHYGKITPVDLLRKRSTKQIDKLVVPCQIFLRSDCSVVINLFKMVANSQILPHLDPNNPLCTERMLLLNTIIKKLSDPSRKKHTTHISAIDAIFEECGYDYKKEDELVKQYAYVTAPPEINIKYPLKTIKINSRKKL